MTFNAHDIILLAKGEVGYHEGRSGGHWNNHQKYSPAVPGLEWSQNQAWCQTFQTWLCEQAGFPTGSFPVTASVAIARDWWKQQGRFSEYPAIGAQCIMGVHGNAHVGLVYAYDEKFVYTIEGNTNATGSAEGDGVYLKTRYRKDPYVYGYGYPKYPDGIVSADPTFKKPTGVVVKKPITEVKVKPPVARRVAPPFPGREYFRLGVSNRYVTQLDKQLVRLNFTVHNDGNGYQPGPYYSEYTRRNVQDLQHWLGFRGNDADGFPGPETWRLAHERDR